MKTLRRIPRKTENETGQIARARKPNHAAITAEAFRGELVRYYSEAGPDYAAWSPNYNMHFGYYGRGMNPLRLEPMLDRMSREVLERLGQAVNGQLLDAGCGVGTAARFAAREFNARVTGISIVPWQIEKARALTDAQGMGERTRFIQADYTRMPFPRETFEGVYAMESACYAPGYNKRPLLREMYRVLKPGGRVVIADGFLKHRRPMHRWFKKVYDLVCRCWSLDTFAARDDFLAAMKAEGFRNIRVEDISWNVAPSAAFVPWTVVRFLCRELFRGGRRLTEKRRNNVIAPLMGLILGAARKRFGYYIVTAEK